MNATAVVQRMTPQDAQILAAYADPEKPTMRAIATKLGVTLEEVNEICVDMARGDRQVAHTLVDSWRRTPKGKRWTAKQKEAEPESLPESHVVTGQASWTQDSAATVVDPKPEITVDLTPPPADTRECYHGPECPGSGPDCDPAEPAPTGGPYADAGEYAADLEKQLARALEEVQEIAGELADERRLHSAAIAERDAAVKGHDAVLDQLAALNDAAGRDINHPNQPLVERVAELLKGRNEARDRALELAKRIAELEMPCGCDPVGEAVSTGDEALKEAALSLQDELRQLADRTAEWRQNAPLREELARIEARAAEIRAQLGVTP